MNDTHMFDRPGRVIVAFLLLVAAVLACGGPPAGPAPERPSSESSGSGSGAAESSPEEEAVEEEAVEEEAPEEEEAPQEEAPVEENPAEEESANSSAPPLEPSLPGSVQEEIFWGLGGGSLDDGSLPAPCVEGAEYIWIITDGGQGTSVPSHPYYQLPAEDGVFGMTFFFKQCNIPPGADVAVTFTLPDGSTADTTAHATDDFELDLAWTSVPGELSGRHEVQFNWNGQSLVQAFSVERARYPIVRGLCQVSRSAEDRVVLTGFAPGEQVAVLVYEEAGTLSGSPTRIMLLNTYDIVTMDGEGAAVVTVPPIDSLVIAVGENPDFLWEEEGGSPMPYDGYDRSPCG